MRSPFSLYEKQLKSGAVWYARFYNSVTQKYSITRSTGVPCTSKKGRKREAFRVASEMVEKICLKKTPFFLDFLKSFWKENSSYLKSKRLLEKKPLSTYYVESNRAGIEKHVKPYKQFSKLLLSDLKPGIFEDWKIWMIEKGVGTRRVNAVLQAMSVPVRNAVSRGELKTDPFSTVKKVSYTPKEKGILSNEEVEKLLKVQDNDARVTLAVLLAVLSGLRRGEIRGLCWGDIIQNEGLKIQTWQ